MKKPKRRKKKNAKEKLKRQARFWLAINGASVAASPFPFENVVVRPTPEMIFGFLTRAEQVEAQRLLLKLPLNEVISYMKSLQKLVKDGVVVVEMFSKPKPPSSATRWISV